jgi:hypothetical protein
MANKATLAFADAIKSANSDMDRVRNNKAAIVANRKVIGKVVRMLSKSLNDRDHLYISNDYDSRPYIGVTLYNLESFKCLQLETLLSTLNNIGDAKSTKDWPSSLNRDYKFDLGYFDVSVSAYVRDDSPTCKRVVVGTKMQQVDTYKIVCE